MFIADSFASLNDTMHADRRSSVQRLAKLYGRHLVRTKADTLLMPCEIYVRQSPILIIHGCGIVSTLVLYSNAQGAAASPALIREAASADAGNPFWTRGLAQHPGV